MTPQAFRPAQSPGPRPPALAFAIHVQYEPALHVFAAYFGLREVARYLQHALETTVCNFQLIITPPFGHHRIAADPAHDQFVVGYYDLHVFGLDARQVELDLPAFGAAVYVNRRL